MHVPVRGRDRHTTEDERGTHPWYGTIRTLTALRSRDSYTPVYRSIGLWISRTRNIATRVACPLYSQKRTCAVDQPMSVLHSKATRAPSRGRLWLPKTDYELWRPPRTARKDRVNRNRY